MTCIDILDFIVASQEAYCHRILSASEDLPSTYATLKNLGVAAQIRDDMRFTRHWRDNDCEFNADNERLVRL